MSRKTFGILGVGRNFHVARGWEQGQPFFAVAVV